MQKELDTIKNDIANAVKLIHYDPNQPAVIETDASFKGLGAVLIQDGKPVRFLSKALTPAEVNYSNIEQELLAVLFACEKLHVWPENHCAHQPQAPAVHLSETDQFGPSQIAEDAAASLQV